MSEYKSRDGMALDEAGGYYIKHVAAMTSEGLHHKNEIAGELAYRDCEIDRLTKERDNYKEGLQVIVNQEEALSSVDYIEPATIARAHLKVL